jgi:hypothetical protein
MGIRLSEEPRPSADPEKVSEQQLNELGKKLNPLIKNVDLGESLVIPKHLEIINSNNNNNDLAVILLNENERHIYLFDKNGSYVRSFASKFTFTTNKEGASIATQSSIKPFPLTKMISIFSSPKVIEELTKQSEALALKKEKLKKSEK